MAVISPAAIEIGFNGAADLRAAFVMAPEIVAHELVATTWQASLLLQREVQEITPSGVGGGGGLKGSISAREPRVLADNVIGTVATSIAHAVPVELGTRPHFPPIDALVDWVRAKFGAHGEDAERIAGAVARKIAIHGTEGAHMFSRAFDRNADQVRRLYDRALARILAKIGGKL